MKAKKLIDELNKLVETYGGLEVKFYTGDDVELYESRVSFDLPEYKEDEDGAWFEI